MFDGTTGNLHTPKAFEQSRSDANHSVSTNHEHYQFTDSASVPQRWCEHLNCCHCKQQFVKYRGEAFLTTLVPFLLSSKQTLVISVCYEEGKAMGITTSGVHECPQLLCNAEESDTRVWLHVVHSACNKKLLFSPDTGVYHIGCVLEFSGGNDIYVQLNFVFP